MRNLRDVLQEKDPGLFQALENSWRIASLEWIPLLRMGSESYAGLPHCQHVESWMDKIALACEPFGVPDPGTPFGFNPMEIYIALNSALFHDIGRGYTTSKKSADTPHGAQSREILNKNWAQLGIVSGRVAEQIGNIAAFHTAKGQWRPLFNDVVKIHPWGAVHTEAIAALLCLADELDTAYTRVTPRYMKSDDLILGPDRPPLTILDIEKLEAYLTKGLMRDFISDLDLDPGSDLIKTVLFPQRLPDLANQRLSDHAERGNAASWLAELYRSSDGNHSLPEQFRPEDHFFSYLEHLRGSVEIEIIEFLAEQYQKANGADRARLLRDCLPPVEFPGDRSLEYMLQLGERQMPGIACAATARARQDIAQLEGLRDLIEKTVHSVDELIKTAGGTAPSVSFEVEDWLKKLLLDSAVFEMSVDGRRKTLDEQARMTDRGFAEEMERVCGPLQRKTESADATRSLLCPGETRKSEKGAQDSPDVSVYDEDPIWRQILIVVDGVCDQKPLSLHARLLELFRFLLRIDLVHVVPDGTGGYSSDDGVDSVFRRTRSWPVKQYVDNLMVAFHVYLANVRRLWEEDERLDYRFKAAGNVEASYGDMHNPEKQSLISKCIVIQKASEADSIDAAKAAEIDEEGALERLKYEIGQYVDSRRCYSDNKRSIDCVDFQFAVRLIFMQWLSNDVYRKNEMLKRIMPGLSKLGVPFRRWLIEYENQLFDSDWFMAIEPNLDVKYVIKVCEKVYELRSSLRRDPSIPWEALAAALHEPKKERAKSAAARLSNMMRVLRYLPEESERSLPTEGSAEKCSQPSLHFGHFLVAERERNEEVKRAGQGRVRSFGGGQKRLASSLEVSYSAWHLSDPSGNDPASIRDFLSRINGSQYVPRSQTVAGKR
jgi:hypothetical protein